MEAAAQDVDQPTLRERRPSKGDHLGHLDAGVEQRPEGEHGAWCRGARAER
jgi:hypothetical protein